MLRRAAARRGGGGIADKLFPGYKDKLWAKTPLGVKQHMVKSENDGFEKAMKGHEAWQQKFLAYKEVESKFAPSAKFRKPVVDWRRQLERGTMSFGRWYEGPYGTDYRTPGNTHDRLANVQAPFTEAEWEDRKNYRSFDLLKLSYFLVGIFLAYRATSEWPVVWCEEAPKEEDKSEN